MKPLVEILSLWSRHEVHTLRWLLTHGLGQVQAFRSHKAGELRKIGSGVYIRPYDALHWAGGLQALQKELGLSIHVGGISALELRGSGHNITSTRKKIKLITYETQSLPRWITANNWGVDFEYHRSSLFDKALWLEYIEESGMEIQVSSRELAILEFIDQSKYEFSFESTENYLLGLMTMRSSVLQELLEQCRSIKVKRIFLYLSEKMELPYFSKLDLSRLDLGSGKRVIIKGGRMNSKYQITVEQKSEASPF